MGLIISPSILNSNFVNLHDEINMLNASEADWIHLDVMDGVFVPNITIGQPVVAAIHKISRKPLDVHLMIVDPDRYIDDFAMAGAANITVHFEACIHLHRTIQYIKQKGLKAGVAINPHTPVQELEEIIADVDLILNMTVNPGFGGQKFIGSSYEKILRLKELILKKNSKSLIEVDGGVDLNNASKLKDAGVDIIVAGSSIFKSSSPSETIRKFKRIE
jgi:ribulose-phosphate 3-epimerase